jgi:hypothetical protein
MRNSKLNCYCSRRIVLEKTIQQTWRLAILAKLLGFFFVLASDYWR